MLWRLLKSFECILFNLVNWAPIQRTLKQRQSAETKTETESLCVFALTDTIADTASLRKLSSEVRIYSDQGHLYSTVKKLCEEKGINEALHFLHKHQGKHPFPSHIITFLVRICFEKKDICAIKSLHSLAESRGLLSIPFFCDQFIRLFASCGDIQASHDLFSRISHPSLYTWNAIICAYSKLGRRKEAFQLYDDLLLGRCFSPDKYTFLGVLKACSSKIDVEHVRVLHSCISKNGLDLVDLVVGNALIDTYMKCDTLQEGFSVFESMPYRDLVTWGSIMKGYVQCGHGDFALQLYEEMYHQRIKPDGVILSTDPKPRLRWTSQLHQRFVDAITQLGGADSKCFDPSRK